MKTVILGSGGQLAFDIQRAMSNWPLVPISHKELDICDYVRTRETLREIRPEVVINAAAFVRVDDCEDQVEKAFQVNAFAVRHLALVCAELDCVLVHLSTDYVFGGERRTPYSEKDTPNPLNVYGVSKLSGEYFVRNLCPKHFVVRSSGLYGKGGSTGKDGNFVETMIRLAEEGEPIRVVNDQIISPTYTKDLAERLVELVQNEAFGLYHITNSGECSWWEFAERIFELLRMDPDLAPMTSAQFGAKAPRPFYSVLSNTAVQKAGVTPMRRWEDAFEGYMREMSPN